MIRPTDDNGVILQTTLLQCIQDTPHLGIHKAHRCQVGTNLVLHLLALIQKLETWFGELPVKIPGKPRCILAVIAPDRGKNQGVLGIEIKPFLRCIEGNMRTEKTDSHKKGILLLLRKFIHRPVRCFVIQLIRVLGRPNSPIH